MQASAAAPAAASTPPAASGGESAAATKTGGAPNLAQHHHHHHHHHHAAGAAAATPSTAGAPPSGPAAAATAAAAAAFAHQSQQQSQQQQLHRSKKQLQELASLPSHDREAYYDCGPSTGYSGWSDDGGEDECGFNEGEDDCSIQNITPRLTNRGNKLLPGAKFIRKGRLGGWENHEVFTSRSAFPSNNNYSTSPAFSAAAAAARLPSLNAAANSVTLPTTGLRHAKPGYHPITPNLSLVPTSSTLAARPDRDIHLTSYIPDGRNPDKVAYLEHTKKRRKLHTTHSGLASTSGPSANHTAAPIRAYLPIPPQNPVELVASPLVSRTFSPKNRTLEKLALSATDLIEQDIPLLRALTRLTDFMRGNSIAGLRDGIIGLPFEGDYDKLVQPDDAVQSDDEEKPPAKQNGNLTSDQGHLSEQMQVDEPSSEALNASEVNGTDSVPKIIKESTVASSSSRKRRRSVSMDVDIAATDTASAEKILAENEAAHADTAEATEASKKIVKADDIPVPIVAETTGTAAVAEADIAMDAAEGVKVAPALTVDTSTNGVELTNGSASAPGSAVLPAGSKAGSVVMNGSAHPSRAGSPSAVLANGHRLGGDAEEEEEAEEEQVKRPRLQTARLPPVLARIAEPHSYIDSLFVSQEDIRIPLQNGMEQQAPPPAPTPVPESGTKDGSTTPAAGAAAGQGGTISAEPPNSTANGALPEQERPQTHARLTPADQLATVQLCLSELTKFLSDSLEYRDRLGEIRDQVLGVEKRRKGVWNMARAYAHQMIWEESAGRMENGDL